MTDIAEANRAILKNGSLEPGIGAALITTVQVDPGFEHSYNAWYGGDHYYAGMMALPWCFSGSRWISTARLRALRRPDDSSFVSPVTDGNFLNMYLGFAGHEDEFFANILTALDRLTDEQRMHRDGGRRQVFTAHQNYLGAVYRDAVGPRDIHAFDHPYPACVLEVLDAPTPEDRDELERWLLTTHLPGRLPMSAASMVLAFRTREYVGSGYVAQEMPTERFGQRVVLLWMLTVDPQDDWDFFASEGSAVAESGLGVMEYVSGYLRLEAGTDKHLDDLHR